MKSTEKLPEYSAIKSIVEPEIQEEDVNKENKIDEERKGCKTSFKNTKLPCNKGRFRRHHKQKNAIR